MNINKNLSEISFIVHQTGLFSSPLFLHRKIDPPLKLDSLNHCAKQDPAHLLCAVSGGQDSILVLLLLVHLKTVSQLKISMVYCNHFWQKENFYTLHNLCKLAYLLGFPINFVVPKNTINSEADGHIWRHTNFSYVAICLNTDLLLTGHTGNDQIETAVWHFLRGTGPKGLVSLEPTSYLKATEISNSLLPPVFYKKKKKSKKKLFRWTAKQYFGESLKIDVLNISWKRPINQLTAKHCFAEWQSGLRSTASQNGITGGRSFQINQVQMHATQDYDTQPLTEFSKTFKTPSDPFKKVLLCNPSTPSLRGTTKRSVATHNSISNLLSYNIKILKYDSYYHYGEQSKKKGCKIQRPLLNISRSTIKKLIIKNNFPVVQDGTNINLRFLRNKIRLILMPLFRYYIQTRCDSHINNFLTILEKEQLYLETVVQNLIHLYSRQPDGLSSVGYLPQSVQLLIVKTLLQCYGVSSPKKTHIECFEKNTSKPF